MPLLVDLFVQLVMLVVFSHIFAWLVSMSGKGEEKGRIFSRWRGGCVTAVMVYVVLRIVTAVAGIY